MDPKRSTLLVSFWSLQKNEHLSMPQPKERRCSRTQLIPNSTNSWQICYFVLIEREARLHPDLIPVTRHRPTQPPSLNLASSVLPYLPFLPK